MAAREGTKIRALREAKGLVQRFGFNGFSFQQVADLIGIKKPSLYDHFKSKDELGKIVVNDYFESFATWTETIDSFDPRAKIGALFDQFFRFAGSSGKYCPLSAMVADYHTLPSSIKKPLAKVFHFQRDWLKKTIEQGQKNQAFARGRPSGDLATLLLSIGLGAQVVARITEDPNSINRMKEQVFEILKQK